MKKNGVGAYRFGFNGKENDGEVKGIEGSQQDYGMRIYDPRVGRFLSVDPISAKYPELTPYQYASNNPVEGVDLDGLEYVSSKEVRIEVVGGIVRLKLANLNYAVRSRIDYDNDDPRNWGPDAIGIDLSIGRINLNTVGLNAPEPDSDPGDANPNNRIDQTEIGKPIAKSTGLPDRRYKDRTVTTAPLGAARGVIATQIVVDLAVKGISWYIQDRIEDDETSINKHIQSFKLAAADVNYALQKTNLIPPEFQTERYLSDIINVVLSGESLVGKNDHKTGSKILEVGKNIYNTLSIKRKEYTGRLIETSRLDGISNKTRERNPAYDAQYVNENPPLGEQPKRNQ